MKVLFDIGTIRLCSFFLIKIKIPPYLLESALQWRIGKIERMISITTVQRVNNAQNSQITHRVEKTWQKYLKEYGLPWIGDRLKSDRKRIKATIYQWLLLHRYFTRRICNFLFFCSQSILYHYPDRFFLSNFQNKKSTVLFSF